MRCEDVQLELSARLDAGEDRTRRDEVDRHVAGCRRCTAFQAGSLRLRERTRLQVAPPVPDLVPDILRRIRATERPSIAAAWPRAAAVLIAGAVTGALLAGGLPALRRRPPAAQAAQLPALVAAAARSVTSYRAVFDIVERGFHPSVLVRRFRARISFGAPEAFRVEVRDRTAYPSGPWPRNDLLIAVDRRRWLVRGPATCPRDALPMCAPGGTEVNAAVNREPFDEAAPMPADIVLPVRALSEAGRVVVTGTGSVLGRETLEVELAYRDAAPLFDAVQAAGSWRPLFPLDEVRLSLDASSYVPLAAAVHPAPGPERAAWAVRNGLPRESPERPVLALVARSAVFDDGPPAPARRARGERDLGFVDAPFDALPRDAVLPRSLAGLRPYRGGSLGDAAVRTYTRGLSWLKVKEHPSWKGPGPFGVDATSVQTVPVNGGVGFYQPASASRGRRVALHALETDVVLETNLPRTQLLRIAASVPVDGVDVPASWLVRRWPGGMQRMRVPLAEAIAAAPFTLVPRPLPAGMRITTVSLTDTRSGPAVTIWLASPATELDELGLRLHQARAGELPPPLEPDVVSVRVADSVGRYSATRGELEWVERGVYRSLRSSSLTLGELLGVARSLRPASEAS